MDPVLIKYIVLTGIVFFSYTAQTISGFGSTVIAVTLGAHLFPLHVLIPALVMLDLLLNGFLSLKYYSHIEARLLFLRIIPFMLTGTVAGLLLFSILAGPILKTILGLLVMALSVWGLLTFSRKSGSPLSPIYQKGFFLLGGIVHGMYASGGPVIVYAAVRLGLGKTTFRAVLTALWTLLSAVMTGFYLVQGQWSVQSGRFVLFLLPALLIGLWLGELLHHKIEERQFRLFIYILLFLAGATLI